MADRTCPKCNAAFRYPSRLQKHLKRKTPCAPIVTNGDLTQECLAKKYSCRYCGRRFASKQSLSFHTNHSCGISTSEAGMECLFEQTLQAQVATLHAKVEELTKQMAKIPQHGTDQFAQQTTNNTAVIGSQTNTTISVVRWLENMEFLKLFVWQPSSTMMMSRPHP